MADLCYSLFMGFFSWNVANQTPRAAWFPCVFSHYLLLVAVLCGPQPGYGLGLPHVPASAAEPTSRGVFNASSRAAAWESLGARWEGLSFCFVVLSPFTLRIVLDAKLTILAPPSYEVDANQQVAGPRHEL